MKKFLSIIYAIVLTLSMSMVCFANTGPAVQVGAGNPSQKKVVDIQKVRYDLNGNEIPENAKAVKWVDVTFAFYDMGSKGEKKAYEVQMTAVASDADIVITYTTFYAKPKNNKEWFENSIKWNNVHSAGDAIYYEYPDAGPAIPKCSVKATITTNYGVNVGPTKTLSGPIKS